MSGALDTKARLLAEKMLKKFGKTATYKNVVVGTYDPLTGIVSTPTNTEIPITCYIDKATTGEITSGLVSSTDTIILVSAKELGITPTAGDTIEFTEATYQVKSNNPIWSGELVALNRLICLNN